MRTKNFLKHLIIGALLLTTGKMVGQSTTPGNVLALSTDFLGWNTNAANNFPLMVRHDLNQPIEWYTDAVRRMQLTPYRTATINGFTVKQHAYLGISRQPNAFSSTYKAPFSRIHLVDSTSNSVNVDMNPNGFRGWMKNGITMTGNGDQCYIGHKYRGADESDLVLQWSDDAEYDPYLTDRLRFIFTNDYNSGASTGATSLEGLESFRIFVPSNDEAFVGIGDWNASGTDPDERLHILDRTIRIQQLVPDYEDINLIYDKVVMSDNDGRLHWRPISSFPAATDACEWSMSGTSPNHVYTAVGTASATCPDEVENVGIGTSSPGYKLHVVDNTPVSNATRGIHVEANSGTATNTGIFAIGKADSGTESGGIITRAYNGTTSVTAVSGTAYLEASKSTSNLYGIAGGTSIDGSATVADAYAMYGKVSASTGNITRAYGVYARSDATAGTCYGVYGVARNATGVNYAGIFEATSTTAGINYGAYGRAVGGATNYGIYGSVADTSTNNWAGYFVGKVRITGNGYVSGTITIQSDGNLKTNVQPLENAGALIAQLNPSTYEHIPGIHPNLFLPSGPQIGLIAQEVEQVLPQLVDEVTDAAVVDSLGNVIAPEVTFKTVNYIGLITVLIANAKEQQTTIAQQNARLDALEQNLAACCEGRSMIGPGDGSSDGQSTGAIELRVSDAADQRLTITPNPFNEGTVIGYTLPKAGMVSLQVSDATGKSLFNLFEGQQMEGAQRYDWNTSFLAPGMYHVTLLVDGQPLVKKAVKVAR